MEKTHQTVSPVGPLTESVVFIQHPPETPAS